MESNKLKELQNEVSRIRWYHRIDLGNGIVTPGCTNTQRRLKKLGLPEKLKGQTVLDIGAWDGLYSFEAERRGASRVLATDSFCWNGRGGTKAGFDLAKKILKSKVEARKIDVLDISPEKIGSFDIVLFLGILYHMRHPMLALERAFSVTRKLLILETHTDMSWCSRPALAFYPGTELANDATNWFGPNSSAVISMLKAVGFRKIKIISSDPFVYNLAWAIKLKLQNNNPFSQRLFQSRVVFHAWK